MSRISLFEAKIDWSDDKFETEVQTAVSIIRGNIPFVLNMVGSELIKDLQSHIEKDVYDAYDPRAYPRRKDNPKFGTSLVDKKNFYAMAKGEYLEFNYYPDGTHRGTRKDTLGYADSESRTDGDIPIKPNPVHGDVLINRIQTGKGYDWNADNPDDGPPPRPFWNNFVEEEFNGKLVQHFNHAVRHTKMAGNYDYRYYSATPGDLLYTESDGALSTDAVY